MTYEKRDQNEISQSNAIPNPLIIRIAFFRVFNLVVIPDLIRDDNEYCDLRPGVLGWPGFMNHAVWLKGFKDEGEGDVVDSIFEPAG